MSCPVIELTMQLIRHPSISPNDAGCQTIIIERLQSIGFIIEPMNFNDTQNLWAWHGKEGGETLAFAGHTDVVPANNQDQWINPPFEPTIRNGVLFGRGSADMKGSLAAMVVAAERFIDLYPHHKGRLAFLITSDEESSAKNGTEKVVEILIARNEPLDYCLIGEPSSVEIVGDVVKNGRRGSLTCNLTIHGVQGHIAYPHLAKNPIHLAIPMLNELVTIQWNQNNELSSLNSMQISHIKSGNERTNMIPKDLFVQFNFRFTTNLTEITIKTRIKELLEKYQFNYTIDWCLVGQPFFTQSGKLIDTVINVISYYNGAIPQLLTTGGTSDGRFIAKMGAQVVELGPVNTTIHKINECVNAADLQLLSRMYQRIMEQILS